MDIGERLLDLRKSKNLSQEEVAYKLSVSRQTISKWETNQSSPDFDKILPLCDLYGVSTDYLLTGRKESRDNNLKENLEEKRAKGIGISILIYILAVSWITIAIPFLDMDPILAAGIFLAICGVATYKVVYTCIRYKNKKEVEKEKNKVAKQINEIISLIVVIIYFIVSFTTGAWYITWVLFIVCGLCEAVVKLVFMLKEDNNEK